MQASRTTSPNMETVASVDPLTRIPTEIGAGIERTEQRNPVEQPPRSNSLPPNSANPKVFLVLFVKPLDSNENTVSALGTKINEASVKVNADGAKSAEVLEQCSSSNHTVSSTGNGRETGMAGRKKLSEKSVMQKRKRESPKVAKTSEGKRRRPRKVVPDNEKDERYWEVRKKNTEAARKCRAKKKVEDEPDPIEELLGESDQMIKDLQDGRKAIEDFKVFIDQVMTIT